MIPFLALSLIKMVQNYAQGSQHFLKHLSWCNLYGILSYQ